MFKEPNETSYKSWMWVAKSKSGEDVAWVNWRTEGILVPPGVTKKVGVEFRYPSHEHSTCIVEKVIRVDDSNFEKEYPSRKYRLSEQVRQALKR